MKLWIGLPLFLAATVAGQVVYPTEKPLCTSENEECISVHRCNTVPRQFLKSLPSCSTRDKVCCSNLLTHPHCSNRQVRLPSRISAGVPARLGDWPWMAALGIKEKKEGARFEWYCGGALISHRFVLTAAHCRPGSLIYNRKVTMLVRLGDIDLTDDTDADHVDIEEEKFIPHKDYRWRKKPHDIALIKLKNASPFRDNIQPICLPVSGAARTMDYVRVSAHVAGWGHTEHTERYHAELPSAILLETLVVIKNTDECMPNLYKISNASTVICTHSENGEDTCKGDSGGPLMVAVNNIYYAIGVVSFGDPCGNKGANGFYTKVTSYLDWISKTVRI